MQRPPPTGTHDDGLASLLNSRGHQGFGGLTRVDFLLILYPSFYQQLLAAYKRAFTDSTSQAL